MAREQSLAQIDKTDRRSDSTSDEQSGRAPEETATAPMPVSGPESEPESGPEVVDSEEQYDAEDRMGRRSAWYIGRKAVREFNEDQGTDIAASLTYYSVLSIFPAALALLSLLGVLGQGQKVLNKFTEVLTPLVSASTLANIESPLQRLVHSQAATATLVVGVVGALWSASAYISAFGRAMNRVYEVDEGRPFWRLRPLNVLVTLASVVLCGVALVILVVSGPVARSVGDQLNLGSQSLDIWNIAKWPALAVVVMVVVAMLYHATPNVRLPKFRILSVGAFVAIMVWLVASVGFAFYVANFSSFDRTYGSVAGVVIALLWLWLTNVALVFGAEIDSEIERARELHRGLPAEERLQLPVRSDRKIRKAQARREKDAAAGREIRESRVGAGDPLDRPF